MIEFGHGTHVGLRRRHNEDTYCADVALGLFLVADGMGGHAHGERAAALAREAVTAGVREGQNLVAAVRDAGRHVVEQGGDHAGGLPMGTTVAAVRIAAGKFEAAWVGDSRIYLAREHCLQQLSHDQSVVQDLVDRGILDAREAATDPHRNVLTQALGVTPADALRIGQASGCAGPGIRFLLCTDGLTEHVADADLARIVLRDDIAAQEAVDHLLLAALDAGGHDNVTAIVIRCDPG